MEYEGHLVKQSKLFAEVGIYSLLGKTRRYLFFTLKKEGGLSCFDTVYYMVTPSGANCNRFITVFPK